MLKVLLALGQIVASIAGLFVAIGLFRLLFKLGRVEGQDIPDAWRKADPDRYAEYSWLTAFVVSAGVAIARYGFACIRQRSLVAGYSAFAIIAGSIVALLVFQGLGGLLLRKQGLQGLGQRIGIGIGIVIGEQAFTELIRSLASP